MDFDLREARFSKFPGLIKRLEIKEWYPRFFQALKKGQLTIFAKSVLAGTWQSNFLKQDLLSCRGHQVVMLDCRPLDSLFGFGIAGP